MTDKDKNQTCDCGCGGNEESEEYITLEFDDGEEVECKIMGVFDALGKEYIALVPDDESGDVYIYGYREVNEEEFELVDIEDDDEFQKVVAEFDKIVADETATEQ